MNDLYLQGFIDKCAEQGVHAGRLLDFVKHSVDVDPGWALAGTPMASLVTTAGGLAYAKAIPQLKTREYSARQSKQLSRLVRLMDRKGIDVLDPRETSVGKAIAQGGLPPLLKKMIMPSAFYHPAEKQIGFPGASYNRSERYRTPETFKHMTFNKYHRLHGASPGLLAHEVGHALGPKAYLSPKLQMFGKLGPGLGTFGTLAAGDEDQARLAAILGTASSAPVLASEFDASIRGSNILKRLGATRMGRLSPFIGIPTYLSIAAGPLLAHAIKKRLGGYEPEGRKK